MVHTLPPWTTKWRMATIFGQIDDAELAARLGSIVTFDRRGNVAWMDDFEGSSLKWFQFGHGPAWSVDLVNKRALTGSQSCMLTCASTGRYEAYISRYQTLTVPGKIGLEVHFAIDEDISYIEIKLHVITGDIRYEGYLHLYPGTAKIQYKVDDTTWADALTDLYFDNTTYFYHDLKIVIDTDAKKYHRLIFGERTKDLSAIPLYSEASSGERIGYQITAYGAAGKLAKCYVDNVIVTQNED